MIPDLAPWQWLLGTFCAFMIGVAKTGAPGVGTMIAPLMVLTVGDAHHAAAWGVPILSTADFFAVYFWRRQTEVKRLFVLIPWVAAGMIAGSYALDMPERPLRLMIGTIIVLMVLIYIWRRLRASKPSQGNSGFYGIFTGFATTVANAAGPVMNMYLLSQGLAKEQFVATGAWFFLVVNLCKMPIYAYHDLFSKQSWMFGLLMAPAAICGALAGLWIIRNINQRVFELSIISLTALSAILLFR